MKKILLLGVVLAMILGFGGCDKNEKGDEPEIFQLEGKTYAAYAYQGGGYDFMGIYVPAYDVYWVYRFTSTTEIERTARKNDYQGGIIGEIDYYTYILDYPSITIYEENGDTYQTGTFINKNVFRTGSGNNIKEYVER